MHKARGNSQLNGAVTKKEKVDLSPEVRLLVYSFLKPEELITLASKLSKFEREMLREARDGCAYALTSSINMKKPYLTNTF